MKRPGCIAVKPFMIWCVGEGSWSEWDVGMQGMHEQQGRARARRSMRDLAPLIFEYYGLPANVSFFGLTFAMCWCYASQRLAVGGLEGAFQATQYLAMGLFMIVGALASRASGRCAASSRLAIALGLVAAVALAPLLVLPGPWASDPMFMLGVAFVDGALVGWLFLMWASFFARLATRQAYACVCVSVAAAAVFKSLPDLLSNDALGVVAFSALPVLTVACFRRAARFVGASAVDSNPVCTVCYGRGTYKALIKPAVGFFCLVMGLALFMGFGEGTFELPVAYRLVAQLLSVAVAGWALLVGYRSPEAVGLFSFWFAAVVVVTGGLALGVIVGAPFGVLSLAVFTVAQAMAIGLVQLCCADVASRSEAPAECVFGVGWGACFALPMAVGLWATSALGLREADLQSLAIVVLWMLLVALVLMRPTQSPELRLLAGLTPRVAPQDARAAGTRLDELALACGLTAREQEVIDLYAQGRNRGFISSELVISENTVRDHVKSAYRKLGIHNKQELIDLLRTEA